MDVRLGRWLSVDPDFKMYVPLSPYNYVANSPIICIDPNGRDIIWGTNATAADKKLFKKIYDAASKEFKAKIDALKSSTVQYVLNFNVADMDRGGVVKYDFDKSETEKKDIVNINFSENLSKSDKISVFGNELSGAYQFEKGLTGNVKNKETGKTGTIGYDMSDERENFDDQVALKKAYMKKYKEKDVKLTEGEINFDNINNPKVKTTPEEKKQQLKDFFAKYQNWPSGADDPYQGMTPKEHLKLVPEPTQKKYTIVYREDNKTIKQ
jgi:hypothetical protein